MNRTQKKELIETTHKAMSSAQIVIVTHNLGLSVSEMDTLRRAVRHAGAKFTVSKNRLTKLALAGTDYEQIASMFKGPTAIAYADNDPIAVSKAVATFAKDRENFVILGGAMGSQSLRDKDIKALAELPSLDELRAKLVGMIKTPATRIAGVLQAPAGQVARVIGAYANKSES